MVNGCANVRQYECFSEMLNHDMEHITSKVISCHDTSKTFELKLMRMFSLRILSQYLLQLSKLHS